MTRFTEWLNRVAPIVEPEHPYVTGDNTGLGTPKRKLYTYVTDEYNTVRGSRRARVIRRQQQSRKIYS